MPPSRIQNSDCRNIDQLDYEEEKGKKILTGVDRIIDFVDFENDFRCTSGIHCHLRGKCTVFFEREMQPRWNRVTRDSTARTDGSRNSWLSAQSEW